MYAPQQADGAGHDRVEHRLDIRLRLADDAQDVAGGGLRVQRRGQLAVARLELGEQAHVLDGDHGLRCKGFEELDLFSREWPGLGAANKDGADRRALTHERHCEHCPPLRPRIGRLGFGIVPSRFGGENVVNVDRSALDDGAAGDAPRRERSDRWQHQRNGAEVRDATEALPFNAHGEGIRRPANPRRSGGHDVQHGLDIGRRAADDPEDLSRGRLLL